MAQIVIDGVLFSPVLAHSLEPGDVIAVDGSTEQDHRLHVWPVVAAPMHGLNPAPWDDSDTEWLVVTIHHATEGRDVELPFGLNEPVLRAVGAHAGRGGAR